LHRHGMVGHLGRQFFAISLDLHEALAFRRADSFHAAARKLLGIGHIEQPILEACGTQIGDQNFHVERFH
jgi:hypothetical protein